VTREFWERLTEFSSHISDLVVDELSAVHNKSLRDKLIGLVSAFHILPTTEEAHALARKYVEAGVVVETYSVDALHLAIASTSGMEYLVSWNFRHIVNTRTRSLVATVNLNNGLTQLEIVAPPELR
jgi:predicted nucleic acid-binding protein